MVYLLASGPATLRLFRNIVCAAASSPPPRSHSNRLRFRAIVRYGRNARKYTNFFREIAIIQADIRIFERSRVKNRPKRTDLAVPTYRSSHDKRRNRPRASHGTATTRRHSESRGGPSARGFRFHAPPELEHEPFAIPESATRCLTFSPAAPPRSYRHKAALSPTLANELLGILHPYRIFVLLYGGFSISERHRADPTASVIRRPSPAATGRVYKSAPPLTPLLGGDFGRYAPKKVSWKYLEYIFSLISAGTVCVATKTLNCVSAHPLRFARTADLCRPYIARKSRKHTFTISSHILYTRPRRGGTLE